MELLPITIAKERGRFEGLLMSKEEGDESPLVLIFPSFVGRSDADLVVGKRLVDAGYRALACDVYGEGRSGASREECSALMQPLMEDRDELGHRLLYWLDAGATLAGDNRKHVAAIGFCFGGLCALDLARTGADFAGAASFHGLFTPRGTSEPAPIKAKVIAFHGWDDPMVPPEQVEALGGELSAAGADWQIHAFGGTMHGFTNPAAAAPELGILYNEAAASRAWASLTAFLAEVFS
jgi:dienelactone hydrolase